MNEPSRRRADQLFQRVVALTPEEQRAYLDEHCRDRTLRAEVEKLLDYDRARPGSRTADVRAVPGAAVHESAPGRGDLRRPPSPSRSISPSAGFDHGRFLPGTVIGERYRIVGLLGRGGMGEVYRADDLELGQSVALKFLPERLARDQEALDRFRGEVRLARQVSHPNVCRVYDIGQVDGQYFLSMEYVDGEDLGLLLKRIGRFPGDRAIEVARQLCLGLAAAHEKEVLHRDLKPANVMVDGRGKVLITDFGLADFAHEVPAGDVRSGTPAYMAPEQLAGREVSAQSDIYSLGLVLHEIFTGKPVWEASSLAELFEKRAQSSTRPPSTDTDDVDPAVARVIQRCLEADPRNRPSSAVAVAAALPGGDPLAAAVAAGETPSPEMVAAAGGQEGLRPAVAIGCLLLFLAGLVALPFLLEKVQPLPRDGFESPEVLERDARTFLDKLGCLDLGAYRDYGYASIGGEDDRGDIYFWYRQSPVPLIPSVEFGRLLFAARVSETNPVPRTPGMLTLRLKPDGGLLSFHAVPPREVTPAAETDPGESRSAGDWKALAGDVLGTDLSDFVETKPSTHPPVHAETVLAWKRDLPDDPVTRQVELGSLEGRVVHLTVLDPVGREVAEPQGADDLGGWAWAAFVWPLFLLAAVLVPRNLRQGRGDRRGAFRLAGFAFAVRLLVWFLISSHVPHSTEFLLWASGVALATFAAAYTWALYIALEPFLRRLWPTVLISWTRLVSGKLRDPVVGRDLLVGLLCGMAWLVLASSAAVWLELPMPLTEYQLLSLLGGRMVFIGPLAASWLAMLLAMLTGLLYVALRGLLRRPVVALAAFLVLRFAVSFFLQETPLPASALLPVLEAALLLRFGIVGLLGLYLMQITAFCVLTSDLELWYSGSGIVALGFLLALASFCCFNSLGGRQVFREIDV